MAKHLIADLSFHRGEHLKLAYHDHSPPSSIQTKGTILLIHGFPQTSYQYRHVLPLLAKAGYRTIAPDYRGAGASNNPAHSTYTKTALAADMIALLDDLRIIEKIHVIGHDIGGMIAYALATRHADRVRSVCWGECPLPGTTMYDLAVSTKGVDYFHFMFHAVPDLAEALVAGKERVYVEHFLGKLTRNADAFSEEDVEVYARALGVPGAMRSAVGIYSAFEQDKRENLECLRQTGKCQTGNCLMLSGEVSRHCAEAEDMGKEVFAGGVVRVGVVEGASHYIAEENSEGFDVVLGFLQEVEGEEKGR